jgi:hypothetical protein
MSSLPTKHLVLSSLNEGIPVIPKEAAGFYEQNCIVCFDDQGHSSGVNIIITCIDSSKISFPVVWDGMVTKETKSAYADMVRTTEYAACSIALLTVRETTDYTAIEQAIRGTSIDYYLGHKSEVSDLIFNRVARLETSGILRESGSNTVRERLREKIRRLKPGIPALIAVVEFSKPECQVVKV